MRQGSDRFHFFCVSGESIYIHIFTSYGVCVGVDLGGPYKP